MSKMNVKKCALAAVLSVGFLSPQMPHQAFAQSVAPSSFPIDLFEPSPSSGNDGGGNVNIANRNQGNSGNQSQGNQGNQGNRDNRSTGSFQRPQPSPSPSPSTQNRGSTPTNSSRPTMRAVKVSDEFACNLFENSSQAALMQAITDMSREVQTKASCSTDSSADKIQKNSQTVMQNVKVLQKIMNSNTGAEVNYNELSDAMTATMDATTTIGDILGDNSFLNSKCGQDSMGSGKTLLAFNEILDGIAPLALFAVSMNAALAPALPFVLGGAVATKGITALTKSIENKTIDMSLQDQRMAVFQNTCQYIKVSKKVTYLQLTADNRFSEFRNSLQNELPLYKASLNSKKMSTFTNTVSTSKYDQVKEQYARDLKDFRDLEASYRKDADSGEMNVCYFGRSILQDLRESKSDDFDFPASIFKNLKNALDLDNTKRIKRVNVDARISTNNYYENEISRANPKNISEARLCATNTKEWFSNVEKTLGEIEQLIVAGASSKGGKKTEQDKAREQGKTFDRVRYAMEELSKDSSIVNRSNIVQGADSIKVGLFGSKREPPVLSWIKYTSGIYDQTMASYNRGIKDLQIIAMNLTDSAQQIRKHLSQVNNREMLIIGQNYREDKAQAAALSNLVPSNKNINAEKRTLICSALKQTYVHYINAWDHLGTIQVMCDMVSGVLDNSMHSGIIKYCAGDLLLRGTPSTIGNTQQQLQSYYAQAMLVRDRMSKLSCEETLN
ncbi:hypothetical protein [Bdellovibrio sp. HCB209]|uniref:hypothetical protein n=1 Tax=Bdellovibrio sp. HCB209 TaxID=3394354 RepID=UPI0039B6C07F